MKYGHLKCFPPFFGRQRRVTGTIVTPVSRAFMSSKMFLHMRLVNKEIAVMEFQHLQSSVVLSLDSHIAYRHFSPILVRESLYLWELKSSHLLQ